MLRRGPLRKAALIVALVTGTTLLSSCATIREDPVLCGTLGAILGGVAGGFLGAAVSTSEPTFPAIAGSAIGATAGGYGAYQVCKRPTLEDTADAKARRQRAAGDE